MHGNTDGPRSLEFTELSSLLPTASPGALRFSGCKAPGTAPGARGEPWGQHRWAAQMGLGVPAGQGASATITLQSNPLL